MALEDGRQVRKSDEREFDLFLPVASFEDVQLLLAQHCPGARALPVRVLDLAAASVTAARPGAAICEAAGHPGPNAAAAAEHVVLAVGHAHVLVREIARG